MPIALLFCPAHAFADSLPTAVEIVGAVTGGADPATVGAKLDERVADDEGLLNTVRLGLKAAGRAEDSRRLLDALAARRRSDAVLYNLSVSYIDQLPGHNLLEKGYLSTASIRVVDEILKRHPGDWLALHIRGLNNLYWPDWFNRAAQARTDLRLAVQAGKPLLTEHPERDGLGQTYLALGDALAILDQPAEARAAWAEGARAYPYVAALAERLKLGDAAQHAAVRAARDSDKPIDTDLHRLETDSSTDHLVRLIAGWLYGPGPLEDQALSPGGLANLHLGRTLTGTIQQFNNGEGEPHMPGEIAVGKTLDGKFSDGTLVNKNIDVGHVFLMNGKFKLFLAAVDGGPNHGLVRLYLDRYWNWTIHDDIGIDPGFPTGVIKFSNFMFSTSPRLLPASTQTQAKEPGGVDRAGSLSTGAFVPGLLGDVDEDGHLEATVNAIGSFPLDSIFLPGAPFAQTRVLRTDIAVSPELAGFLTLANAVSYARAATASDATATGLDTKQLDQGFVDRLKNANAHFKDAGAWVGGLDPEAKAAYSRLTVPTDGFAHAADRDRFVCAADGDLAVLGARLTLIRSQNDSSRLAGLFRCAKR